MFNEENNKILIRVCMRLAVCAYLIYIGVKQFEALADTTNQLASICFGVLFALAGAAFAVYAVISFLGERKRVANGQDGQEEK